MKPTLVSLFSGAGGLDIGLEMAGFRTLSAVERDEDCIETLQTNRGAVVSDNGVRLLREAAIVGRSIADVSGSELKPAKSRRTVDLLAGGPPCQPFSSAGKMLSIDDPRGRLFEHFVRIASELKPRLILLENVRGLVTARGRNGEPGEVLREVSESFERIGYATTFQLLNAADYGCPQRRVRLFMMATRCTALPEFPEPTHGESRLPWVTLGDYLRNRTEPAARDLVRPSAALAPQLAALRPGTGLRSVGIRETTRPGGHWGYRQGAFVADPSLPARTVTASASQDWVRLSDGSLRRLTLEECAGLQGFPPDWRFVGSKASRFRQVGNAVPIVFGVVLGAALLKSLGSPRRGKIASAPLPTTIQRAIVYTRNEERRNGESRKRAAEAALGELGVVELKERGTAKKRKKA